MTAPKLMTLERAVLRLLVASSSSRSALGLASDLQREPVAVATALGKLSACDLVRSRHRGSKVRYEVTAEGRAYAGRLA